jgi:hypothetical protein
MHIAEWAPATAKRNQYDRPLQVSWVEIKTFIIHSLNRESRGAGARFKRLNVSGGLGNRYIRMTVLNGGTDNEAQDEA